MSLQKVRHEDQIFLWNSEVDLVGAVTTQSCHGTASSAGLSAYQSQLNSTRQEGAGSHPLPHTATTFPWIMLLWLHPYTPWGGSFSVPKSNACLSWISLLAVWSQHPCEHPAHPKGHCACACRFALSVAHRFTPEGSLSDQKCYTSSSEYNFAKT